MRIFLAGDYRTGTGPANVTKSYLAHLPEDTLYLKAQSKLARIPEILIKTLLADVVLYSGYSRQNLLGLKLAGLLKKPSAYLMHGCVEHENAINGVMDEEMNQVERKTMEYADRIFAVSRGFSLWLKEAYPKYRDKIDYAINGIDFELPALGSTVNKNERQIISIGGGMPRKKIKYICEAVERLNQNREDKLSLIVIGAEGLDTDEINKYPFVQNLGLVGTKEAMSLLQESALFVQNSCFETFGLAPVEALMLGCSLLLSRQTGALELFAETEESDVIHDYEDVSEIAEKIDYLLEHQNAERLTQKIDKESTSWEERTCQLIKKLEQLK